LIDESKVGDHLLLTINQYSPSYVIPQQLIQAGGLGQNNQAALHYGHIPQLASQMQGLQIAHPHAPVSGYLPPQHQWSTLWTHPIAPQPQPSMRIPTPIQPGPPHHLSPQSTPVQQSHPHTPQPQTPLRQSPVIDNKPQISMPL